MGSIMKRNIKIIILLVCVLFVSIGIVYALPDSPTPQKRETTEQSTPQLNIYIVDWALKNVSSKDLFESVSKGSNFQKTFSFNTPYLHEIRFNLSWFDDKVTFHGKFGLDTLILKITDPDGNVYRDSARSARKTRLGYVEMVIPVNSELPASLYVTAASRTEAEQLVLTNYSDYTWVNQNFTVEVTVRIGEVRLLKRSLDKGNTFSLDIRSSYYIPTVTQTTAEINQNDSVVQTGRPMFSDCPVCHGHFHHSPWCPYYDDPFD